MLNASAIRGRDGASITNRVRDSGIGNGGDIRIITGSLSLSNGAQLSSDTFGQGNAGNVIITTDFFSLTNNSRLAAGTLDQGNAGNVVINARNRVAVDNSTIFSTVGSANSETIAVGKGGDIRITTGSLSLTRGAQLSASTFGQGDAGNVVVNARNRISLDGGNPAEPRFGSAIFSSVGSANSETIAVGKGGNIRITTGSLSLTNGTQLSASTVGQGDAGNIIIQARDRVSLDGVVSTDSRFSSGITSAVGASNVNRIAVGNGGDIRITTGSLSLTNSAQLRADTLGQGDAGNVVIRARNCVSIAGEDQQGFASEISTSTQPAAEGRGGNISLVADSVHITNGTRISTATLNGFPGGNVILNANTFEATDGGQVITATSGSGRAGNITLNVADQITLSGVNTTTTTNPGFASGLYASTNRGSSGRGGTIQLTTDQLAVSDQARVTVNSQGSGVAGNINLTANTVQLDDQARITAETAAEDGGNIALRNLELLQLRNNSRISTTAGNRQSGGDGGNIDIDADFIVAFPGNSDIRADAFTGRGGNVRIASEGLFGIEAQPQDNSLTNDITASSEQGVQGVVDITTPETDPEQGLSELPVTVVDASNQISQTCIGQGGAEASEFVVSGRGGLPPSPVDALIGEESLSNWARLDEASGEESKEGEAGAATAPSHQGSEPATAIVEAQGWMRGEDGKVKLIATAPASAVQPAAICP
jgi:large exoprotein involved in heme utilization and adhesion